MEAGAVIKRSGLASSKCGPQADAGQKGQTDIKTETLANSILESF